MADVKEENEKRRQEFIAYHAAHSKAKGDWHWQQGEILGAGGDYVPGQDEGMHWSDIKENTY